MSNFSIVKGSEWKTITTTIEGVIEAVLSVKLIEEGEYEYVAIASSRDQIVEELEELTKMFPKNINATTSTIDGKEAFTVISTNSNGKDILMRALSKFIVKI
jgi:hypothetical protein